ncbi:MAG: nitroreductase family protein [Mycobacterium sp.]
MYPAAENLLLAARECGLGASLTTWHVLYERELKGILGIPRHVRTFAVVPIGYPLRRFGPVNRALSSSFCTGTAGSGRQDQTCSSQSFVEGIAAGVPELGTAVDAMIAPVMYAAEVLET